MASMKIDTGSTYKLKKAMEDMGLSPKTNLKALWGRKPLKNQAPITTDETLIGTSVPDTPSVRYQQHVGDRLNGEFTWEQAPTRYLGKFSIANERERLAQKDRNDYLPLRPGIPDSPVVTTTHEEIKLSPGGEIVKAMNAEHDLMWSAMGCPDPRGRFDSGNRPIKQGDTWRVLNITKFQDRRDSQPHHQRHGAFKVDSYAKKMGGQTTSVYRSSVIEGPVKMTFKQSQTTAEGQTVEAGDITLEDWYKS